MTGFEEVRPFENMWAPLKARLELRQMFERWLSRSRHHLRTFGPGEPVDELSLLELCRHYRLEYPGSAPDIATIWDESQLRIADGGPTFAELVHADWVFFDGGRWIMQGAPAGTSLDIVYPSASTRAFLIGLGKARLVARTGTPPQRAQELAERLTADDLLDRHIPTKNPEWLFGRLWEQLCPKLKRLSTEDSDNLQAEPARVNDPDGPVTLLKADIAAIDKAFLEWSAWYAILGSTVKWDISWGDTEMQCCREAALRVLDRQNLWGTWDNDTTRYAQVLETTFGLSRDHMRYVGVPRKAPPRTLVSRADWLGWPDVEHLMMGRLGRSTVAFAFGVLCSELEMTDIGPNVTTTATTVMSFAANHPMALQQLLFRIEAAPALLVDMLMHQRVACLATRLAIEWRPDNLRDSDQNVSREAQTKAFAVQDSLSLLHYHLGQSTLDLEECASLVTWCYAGGAGSRKRVADSRGPVGRQLLGMIAKETQEVQSAVLQYLVDQVAYEDNLSRARFAGFLDALECLPSAAGVDISHVVALYSKFARELHLDWTDAFSLSERLAARLVATALAQSATHRDAMLLPIDAAKLLRETPDDERTSIHYSVAQTLRQHVRLLARAVAGWPDGEVPTELCDALQTLISRSVIEHAEKGRVGALTERYSPIRFYAKKESSPALDLAAAWRRLNARRQEDMLVALVQSDDPVLLAELLQNLPAAAKPTIQAKLRQLTPGEASSVWSWPELQQRITSLLAAGEYELAREHLCEAQKDLGRAPTEFRLNFFSLELQLLLKEKNWAALDAMDIPPALNEATMRQARQQLDFYNATSQLLRPNGNLASAQVVLQRLAANAGAASTYRDNVFAVALQQLLGPTLQPLTGADRVTGEALLAQINAAVSVGEKSAHSSLLANRALLLLGLQRPRDAIESIAAQRHDTRNRDLELIAVLAKSEMGFRDEAMAILDAAILEFGADDRFVAVKADLQAGNAVSNVAAASLVIDPISSIRVALQQLYQLIPAQVGEILGPSGRGLRGFLIQEVSRAVATLQHMAAMLRGRKNPTEEAKYEDDLNTAVREVLGASLAAVKWHVADQSLGGTTANGNRGERDAVIKVANQEISIYEALVSTGLNRVNTKEHFDKLVSYGICDIYFHVTYSYAESLEPLVEYVKEMLEKEVPSGLTYIGSKKLDPTESAVSGYEATYLADGHREIAIVFLVADLRARAQVANSA